MCWSWPSCAGSREPRRHRRGRDETNSVRPRATTSGNRAGKRASARRHVVVRMRQRRRPSDADVVHPPRQRRLGCARAGMRGSLGRGIPGADRVAALDGHCPAGTDGAPTRRRGHLHRSGQHGRRVHRRVRQRGLPAALHARGNAAADRGDAARTGEDRDVGGQALRRAVQVERAAALVPQVGGGRGRRRPDQPHLHVGRDDQSRCRTTGRRSPSRRSGTRATPC